MSEAVWRLWGVRKDLPAPCLQLLARQRGVIASWQAGAAGFSRQQMQGRLRSGHWQRLHFGVYAAFTGEPSREAVLWAAVLRYGPGSIISHETAAEMDGLQGCSKLIHVTVREPQHRWHTAGILVHRSSRELTVKWQRRLPPRTMTEETVLDLAQGVDSFDDVIALIARACQRRLTTPFLIGETLSLRKRVRWRRQIEQALHDVADGVHSALEYRYLHAVERAHGLPAAERQARAVSGHLVYRDAHYREFGVAVELDGSAHHPAEQRWRDNRRDNAAAADGIVTLRYGWADVTERPCETAREVATVLARRGWVGKLGRCGPNCRA